MSRTLAIAFLVVMLLAGCTVPPPAKVEHEDLTSIEGENTIADQNGPLIDQVQEPEPMIEPEPEPEPEVVSEPEPEPQPVIEVGVGDGTSPIEVSEDFYDRAFREVEELIDELNQIIYRGNFDAWVRFLTDEYFEKYSDLEVLAAASEQPVLKQNGIVLYNLEDYFEFVVVPSRARARLDDLVFYSDTLVEAVSIFRGEPAILYLLRQVDGAWKIDAF